MGQCTPNQYAKRSQSEASISKASLNSSNSSRQSRPKHPILRSVGEGKNSVGKLNEIRKQAKVDPNNKMRLKVPLNKIRTLFKWVDVEVIRYPSKIAELPSEVIKQGTFQEKLAWFRAKINESKKSHQHGFELIQINRQNIIESSLNALEGVNLFKELRVKFTGDKAQDAGGGLLREWIHLCIKVIMSREVGIFKLANTDETAYQLISDNAASDEAAFQALSLLGLVMGKALIQKISTNCPLDYTILRQLCSQPLQLSDVYSYDKAYYQSWVSILEMKNVDQLCLDGTVTHRSGSEEEVEQVEVLPGGKNILVTDQNKEAYIEQLVNFYCARSIDGYLEQLFRSLTQFIPAGLLEIFEPFEFQMLLSGPSDIDILDWKANTVYDGYDPDDQIIQWFWQIVESSGQQGYRNLLHYCTGSTRVPIEGFSKLESNSGHVKKFSIRKIESEENLYPKSYTCFNRLELPAYESKQVLEERLEFILKVEFTEFGLS